jgi:ADP-heptose:LPS heptosyltransferase
MDPPDTGPVLVLRALKLGDLLVAVPALRGIRRHHPHRRIVLATAAALAPLARWSGAVDEVLPTEAPQDLRWRSPDRPAVAVNLHGTGPQSHRALDATHPLRRIGCRSPGWEGPEWADIARRNPHERERWCALLAAFGVPTDPADLLLPPPEAPESGSGAVIVHPGAQYGAKMWPPERFAALAASLHRDGHDLVLTGSAAERPLALSVAAAAGLPESSVLAGRTDLVQLSTLIAHAAALVCGDTGVAHLASAFGTPSVVLFGPVTPAQWGPPACGPHVTLTDDAARRGDPFADDPDPALLGVGLQEVLDATRRAIRLVRHDPAPAPAEPAATSSSRVVERPGR